MNFRLQYWSVYQPEGPFNKIVKLLALHTEGEALFYKLARSVNKKDGCRRNYLPSPSKHKYLLQLQENEIIHALQNGQAQVFEQVVALYKNKIYNTVLSFLQNEADAEDTTQEVFVKAYQQINQFRGDATLATWLYRIAVTQSIDFLRRKKRRNAVLSISRFFGSAHITEEVPDFHHPGVVTEQKETAAVLFKAINQLPTQQAAAFLLQKTEQLSQCEIAAILQLTESAVESLLYRAKTNLQKLLKDYYQKYYA